MPKQIKHNLSAAQKAALRSAVAALDAAVSPGGPLAATLAAMHALPPAKRDAALASCPNLSRLLELGRKIVGTN